MRFEDYLCNHKGSGRTGKLITSQVGVTMGRASGTNPFSGHARGTMGGASETGLFSGSARGTMGGASGTGLFSGSARGTMGGDSGTGLFFGSAIETMGGTSETGLFSGSTRGTSKKECIQQFYILHYLCNIESKVRDLTKYT